MTATKVVYVIAAVVPFGFVILAAALLARAYFARRQGAALNAART